MNYQSALLLPEIKIAAQLLGITFVLLLARLIHLQIVLQQSFYTKSQKNFLRVETTTPLRGNITDRYGNLLATNRPTTNIVWHGTGNAKLSTQQLNTLHTLSIIIGKPLLQNTQLLDQLKYAERCYQKFLIATDIPFDQLGKIAEQLTDNKNINIATHFKRYYPYKSFASHLLGYLSKIDVDIYGKMGLEKIFEDMLKGHKGQKLKTINSFGRNLSEVEIKKPSCGQHIQTTLDIELQKIVEKIFPEDLVGTFIILDPEDGSLLAHLSRRNFYPTLFLDPLQENDWLTLQEKQPFLNRAFNACYPPGSIFKLVTVSAMLENNIIRQDSCWNCQGYSEFGNRQYWCNNRSGHGLLTTEQSLAHSCNILFYETAKKVSIDLFTDYAYRFGLGQKTNIIFAEKEGLIPSTTWKKRVKKEKWWPGETLSVAIGQSYLLVTPIQIARMISAIFSGFLVTPRILLSEPICKEPLTVSLETRKFLQQSMQQVVYQGTGRGVKSVVKDIKIYAKTSTAQMSSLDKRDMGEEYLEHGWFVCYFSYKDLRPLTLVILVEHAGTSRIPAEIARNFFKDYKKMADQQMV